MKDEAGFDLELWDRLAVGVAVLVTASLTFPFLGGRSLWLDEALSLQIAGSWEFIQAESNMWLYHVLLALWLKIGTSEWVMRSLSAVCAVATIPAMYLLARQLLGSHAARIAVVLLSINIMFLSYAQEARGYSLLVLLVTLSSHFFLRLLNGGRLRDGLAYSLLNGLAIYAHFFAVPVIGVQLASVVFMRKREVPWMLLVLSVLGTFALCLPLLILAPFDSAQVGWISEPDLRKVKRLFEELAGGKTLLYVVNIVIGWGLISVVKARKSPMSLDAQRTHAFLLLWLLAPVFAAWTFSHLVQPLFASRYLIICLPPTVLLLASGVARLPRAWARGIVLVAIAAATWPSADDPYRTREAWREATTYVLSQAEPGDLVVFYAAVAKVPFEYYVAQAGREDLELLTPTEDPATYPSDNDQRVWLVFSHHLDKKSGTKGNRLPRAPGLELQTRLEEHHTLSREEKFKKIHVLLYEGGQPL